MNMKKTLFLCLILTLWATTSYGQQSNTVARRIEEGKRDSISLTEAQKPVEITETPAETSVIDFEYFMGLFKRYVTYRRDGVQAVALLIGLTEDYPAIEDQVSFMIDYEIIPRRYHDDFDLDQPLRKGLAAYMFCQAMGLRGGIITRVFGLSERYALQEVAFQGMVYPGNVRDILNGKELVLLLSEASTFLLKQSGEDIDELEEEED